MLAFSEAPIKMLWGGLSLVGMRRVSKLLPSQYNDTSFYFPHIKGHVVLTIDDGLSRGGDETSMVEDVRQLLAEYEAKATFFVCSKYLDGVQDGAAALVSDGHEFGNHLREDLQFVYPKMEKDEFAAELASCSAAIEALPGHPSVRWFRAPQGFLSVAMADAVSEQGLRHALGDTYCDDWALEQNVPYAVRMLLEQVADGSIIIVHMPEKGFRQHTFAILKGLLEGLKQKQLRCLTLSEAAERELAVDTMGDSSVPVDFGGTAKGMPGTPTAHRDSEPLW